MALRTKLMTVLALAVTLLVVSVPLQAHHGASMFDMKSSITVKGTVTSFEWTNPHAMIFADAKDDKGGVQKWTVETRGGPNVLTNAGWTKDSLKPGDQITLIGHPAKDGTYKMRLAKVVLANGQELDLEPHSWY
jgi:hypothetical protein